MNLQKQSPLRLRKMLNAAAGQRCIRCGRKGEERNAHINGFRAASFGKGRGIKPDDLMTAIFCQSCDDYFSESNYPHWEGGSKSIERSEEFLFYICMTNIRRKKVGDL